MGMSALKHQFSFFQKYDTFCCFGLIYILIYWKLEEAYKNKLHLLNSHMTGSHSSRVKAVLCVERRSNLLLK